MDSIYRYINRPIDGKYYYKYLDDKSIIPEDAVKFICKNNLSELPEIPDGLITLGFSKNKLTGLQELPQTLLILWCHNNNLNELPELPLSLTQLFCYNNNIKYLSLHNCQIVKNILTGILQNPVSEGFNSDREFQESL